MVRYLPYNPSSTVRVEESLEVVDGKIFLRHIPKEGSIFIDGFTETDSLSPEPNQFSCQYSLFTFYRDANRVLNFNDEHNGQTLDISYIAVGTVFTAEDANEIKEHLDKHQDFQCILGTDSIDADGGLWFNLEEAGAVLKLKYGSFIYSYIPDYRTYLGEESGAHLALAGTSEAGHYIQLPDSVYNALVDKSAWSFEIRFATRDTTDSAHQSPNQLQVKPLLCFPSNGLLEKNTFNLCVENTYLRLRSTYDSTAFTTSKVVNDGQMHRVSMVKDSSDTVRLYCDGELTNSKSDYTVTFPAKNISLSLKIAYTGYYPDQSFLQLDFYELRVWNKALASNEIFQYLSGDEDNLVAWYIPDNPKSLHDLSNNNRDGLVFNSPPFLPY